MNPTAPKMSSDSLSKVYFSDRTNDARIRALATILLPPSDQIVYFPHHEGARPLHSGARGSIDFFAAIAMAHIGGKSQVLIYLTKGLGLQYEHTTTARACVPTSLTSTRDNVLFQRVTLRNQPPNPPFHTVHLSDIAPITLSGAPISDKHPKTWPRNQVFHTISNAALQFLLPKFEAVCAAIVAQPDYTPYEKEYPDFDWLCFTDAGVKDIAPTELAPDQIKAAYFRKVTNSTRSLHAPRFPTVTRFDESLISVNETLQRTQSCMVWVYYATGYEHDPPLNRAEELKPRYILSKLTSTPNAGHTVRPVLLELHSPSHTTLPSVPIEVGSHFNRNAG